jgi:HlyD family secretion protein
MKRLDRKWIIVGGAALIVLLVVISIVISREQGMDVEVEEVTRRGLRQVVSASGALEPKMSVSISATTSGEIIRIDVVEGQTVEAGDFLLQLDPVSVAAGATGQEASVAAAQAELDRALAREGLVRDEFRRKLTLADADLISRAELSTAEAELRVQEAAVEAARKRVERERAGLTRARHDLDRVTITSPIDGIVTRVNVEPGEVAVVGTMNQPGTVLLVIADMAVMEATVDVDETDVVDLDPGQEARITVDAFPDTVFAGSVTEVATSPKSISRSSAAATDFEVKVTLTDELPTTRSGLSCTVDIITADRDKVLVVPIQSLVVRQVSDDAAGPEGVAEREGVFIVEDGEARFQPVRVGISGERFFEVLSGLEEGDLVVSGTYQALRDLTDGQVVDFEESEES